MVSKLFSCEEAALEVQMSLCPSVCLSVTKLKLQVTGMYRGQTLQVRGMYWGQTFQVRGMYGGHPYK